MSVVPPAWSEVIDTEPAPSCPACGGDGVTHYTALRDYIFGAPGEWSMRLCQSAACQTLWLDPRPRPSEVIKAYRNYYTHSPASLERPPTGSGLRAVYHRIRDAYLEFAYGYRTGSDLPAWLGFAGLLHPGGLDWLRLDAMSLPAPGCANRLLEIGCGNGYLLQRMRTLGWDVEGVDFDAECVESVKRRGIRCRCGDVREQEYAPGTFDAIYMGNVIEHVYRPLELLGFCRQLLSSNGRMVIVTPNASSIGHRWFQGDWRGLEPPRHLQLFTPQSLRTALEKSGFAMESARTTNRGFWYLTGTSFQIRRARRGGLNSAAPVRLFMVRSLGLQFVGRILDVLMSEKGEELLFVALNPSKSR
jgi:SAM-dependent methyltransferase